MLAIWCFLNDLVCCRKGDGVGSVLGWIHIGVAGDLLFLFLIGLVVSKHVRGIRGSYFDSVVRRRADLLGFVGMMRGGWTISEFELDALVAKRDLITNAKVNGMGGF